MHTGRSERDNDDDADGHNAAKAIVNVAQCAYAQRACKYSLCYVPLQTLLYNDMTIAKEQASASSNSTRKHLGILTGDVHKTQNIPNWFGWKSAFTIRRSAEFY